MELWHYLLFICIFIAISLFRTGIRSLWVLIPPSAKDSIFSREFLFPKPVEVELDQTKRDKVLKNGFTPDKVPENLDAIVIGSGIGGLTTAALLAKAGKKVLVLEQHDQAGGCCHVFEEKGYEFDVGIHYVGKMREGGTTRILTDQLSQGRLRWHHIADDYDVVITGENYENKWPINKDPKVQMERLIAKFPEEEQAIRKYFKCVREACKATIPLFLLKAIPKWLAKVLVKTGLIARLFPALKYVNVTLSDVLKELTNNLELRMILSYAFGDYGTTPNECPFMMHASLAAHFYQGGYYPVGGASEIAYTIIPTIEAAGGRVLVRANVKEILVNPSNEVMGVSVAKGNEDQYVLAPMVISSVGVVNTYKKLLSEKVVTRNSISIESVKSGLALFSVFVGLEGSKEELGLVDTNYWIFKDVDIEKSVAEYLGQGPEKARDRDIPLLFLSFPSTKDPVIEQRYPGRSTCAIITVTPYEWFEEWRDERLKHRGSDYQSLKMDIGRRMWAQVCTIFPHLEDKLDYLDVGSPLSNRYYFGTQRGEVYGIDHNVLRFKPKTQIELRPETPIFGLYLTGQDILTCGFSGALHSGLLTASVILQRNLMADITTLQAIWKQEQKKN